MNPTIISIDDLKKTIAGYVPDFAEKFHSESAKLANKHFEKMLKNIKCKNVILMCGGSASGKTEFIAQHLSDFEGIIFDGTLPTIEGAIIKIRQINKSKKSPIIIAIYPDKIKRAFKAFLNRDRKFNDKYFYKTHLGSRKTLLWIAENFPNIQIKIYESFYRNDKLYFDEISLHSRSHLLEFLHSERYSYKSFINNNK